MADAKRQVAGSGETQIGPEKMPTKDIYQGANANPGNLFGDKSSRTPPSSGANLSMGLSCRAKIDPNEDIGEDRDDATGKPMGPHKGPIDNGGASAKLQWG